MRTLLYLSLNTFQSHRRMNDETSQATWGQKASGKWTQLNRLQTELRPFSCHQSKDDYIFTQVD